MFWFEMKVSRNKMRLIMLMYYLGGITGKYAAQDSMGFVTAHGVRPTRDVDGWDSGGRMRVICHSDNITGWSETVVSRREYNREIRRMKSSSELV